MKTIKLISAILFGLYAVGQGVQFLVFFIFPGRYIRLICAEALGRGERQYMLTTKDTKNTKRI